MMVYVRTWMVVVALVCTLALLLHSANAQAAAAPSLSSSPAQKPKCVPGPASPCRVGASLRDPENQEEEGIFNVKARAPSGAGETDSDDDYSDPDQPKDPDQADDDDLVIVGH
ncbi:uncharacterized protein LOC124653831 [Lolium rigidum]|uniref:uncharacterized protein LOC124652815 n=1 Tax=Lolium rigidum TaxID=89674 RepID=UPI001F5D3861|nr:uncharacterized protein LOC124652815 [Lolium rigidum]XP_047048850.1 uncharacterized protein LOC124653831 [Lolium rigidum]